MCYDGVRVTKCGRWKGVGWRWRKRVWVVFMNTTINMVRIKIFMIRAANKPRKQFSINCWDADNEILLCKHSIKVLDGYYIQVYRKSGKEKDR